MYSSIKSVGILVALLQSHGVREVVLCPGSRNIPLLQSLSAGGFSPHQVTDERSAGFVAIGLALGSGLAPVAVVCTSGTALANLHPSVAEAYYQGIPLVVISADRPLDRIGQMEGQTLPQEGIFGSLVRRSVCLPEIHTPWQATYCTRLVNEAMLDALTPPHAPVHINVPLREPLFDFVESHLPMPRVIRRLEASEALEYVAGVCQSWRAGEPRILCLLGQSSPWDLGGGSLLGLRGAIAFLSEGISNAPERLGAVKNFDAILHGASLEDLEALRPDLLITLGGHLVSKRIKEYLRSHPPRAHWHVCPEGQVVDTYDSLTHVLKLEPSHLLEYIEISLQALGASPRAMDYPLLWRRLSQSLVEPHFDYSAMGAVEMLRASMPAEGTLHLGNSSSVRYAQLWDWGQRAICCNRGVSGIEGSLSTAVGYALARGEELQFLIIGDLSFFYDMNALWGRGKLGNLRILLINNSGGEIFHSLQGLAHDVSAYPFIVAPHETSAEGWVRSLGIEYVCARDAKSLREGIRRLTSPKSDRAVVLEVFTDKEEDVRLLKDYYLRSQKNKVNRTKL